jgi:hypothetical protein
LDGEKQKDPDSKKKCLKQLRTLKFKNKELKYWFSIKYKIKFKYGIKW